MMKRKLILTTAIVAAAFASPSGSSAAPFVYVTNRGADDVSQFKVGDGGLLAPLSPFTVGARKDPEGVAVSPDGKSVYVSNEGVLVGEPDDQNASVSQYDIGADGTLSPKSPPWIDSCGSMATYLAVSPDGQSAYVATGDDCNSVYQYDIGAHGTLSPKSPPFVDVVQALAPIAVAVSPDSRSVYVTHGYRPNGDVLQFDAAADGTLSPKRPAKAGAEDFPVGIVISPDGQSVYVANSGDETVSQYDVGSGGRLSPKSSAAVRAGNGPISLAVSPNGTSAYVVNAVADSVSQYDINPVSGALSRKTPATVRAGVGPIGIAVSPDGKNVYVANGGRYPQRGSVSQYRVGAGGELSAKSPPMVTAGFSAFGIALSPLPGVPTTKEQCKYGGWKQFGFKNQGQCIRLTPRPAPR